jgi:hypothetical protein
VDQARFEFLKSLYPALTANEILFNDAEGRELVAQVRAESTKVAKGSNG